MLVLVNHHKVFFVCKIPLLTQRTSFFVSPELSSVRDYVITHSVRSICMYVYVCGILQNWSLYPHTLMYCHGTWTQWSWVESHMWPQQTWGQRSSRGQWPLVQVFGKKGQCIHIPWSVFSNLILQWLQKYVIAKSGETCGSRTASFVFFASPNAPCIENWGLTPASVLW